MIGWKSPPLGWKKGNSDGASSVQNGGAAAARGLIRDEKRNWCGGVLRNIGRGTAFVDELWGVLMVLQLACRMGTTKLLLEVDNKNVVETIKNVVRSDRDWKLKRPIQMLLEHNWNVKVCHIFRE